MSLEKVKHLVPRAERPTDFEMSERLILETLLRGRKSVKPAKKTRQKIIDMRLPLFEQAEQQACG